MCKKKPSAASISPAPKGPTIPAQGNALGFRPPNIAALKGRSIPLARRTWFAPCANVVIMISTSESLSLPETSNGKAAKGNCVAARRGGEQPAADPQSRTKVKPIRPATTASLRGNGEACRASGDPSGRHPSLMAKDGVVEGGWDENAGKVSWWTVEICPGRTPPKRRRAEVRAAIVAMKRRINASGAKGGRKVERPRP